MNWDIQLFNKINHLPHNKFFDDIALAVHYLTYYGWIFAIPVIYCLLSDNPAKKLLAKQLAISMIFAGIVNDFIIHQLVARARPFSVLSDVITIGKLPSEYSFPSGHTAIAFAFAITYFLSAPKSMTSYLFLLGALIIGFGRVYMGFHYPTDVLVGALLGIVSAFISVGVFKLI